MKTQFKIIIFLICSLLLIAGCYEDSDSEVQTYEIGDTGPSGVGIVFYVTDDGLHGLEAAPVDQSSAAQWSTITDALAGGSVALPLTFGTGSKNTDAIIKQNSGDTSAALICRNYSGGGASDWYLPSRDELQLMYTNLKANGIGGFASSRYWSSSENQSLQSDAWHIDFANNHKSLSKKYHNLRIRAIRSF